MGLIKQNLLQTCKGGVEYFTKRFLGPYRKQLKFLQITERYGEKEIENLQLELLQSIVKHSYDSVPYYRAQMDQLGIGPDDFNTLEDIKKIPILTKKDVKEAGRALVSTRYPKIFTRTAYTGGTTGIRLPLVRDVWSISREHAFLQRFYKWMGITDNDPSAYFIARKICPDDEEVESPYAYDYITKRLTLSVYHLSVKKAPVFLKALMRYKIKVLIGYPSAIATLAKFIISEGIDLKMKAVFTTSEVLEISKKEIIEKAFKCKVYDYYGSAERVSYIQMCEKQNYHVIMEYGLTEFVKDSSSDLYRVVSTGFWNKAMPLLRYDTGDFVELKEINCLCQRRFPTVTKIVGRQGEVLITPSGKELGPSVLEAIMENVLFDMKDLHVAEAQVILNGSSKLVLEYVPLACFEDDHKEVLLKLVEKHYPTDFDVSIKPVDKIRRTKSGKALSLVFDKSF